MRPLVPLPHPSPATAVTAPLPLPFRPLPTPADKTANARPACPRTAPAGSTRFWVLSELCIDREPGVRLPDPLPDFDVLLVAGGITTGLDTALRWLAAALDGRHGDRPVLMVAGCPELRSAAPMVEALARGKDLARDLGIRLLSDEAVRIGPADGGGTIILGSTLWTDWCLLGAFEGRLARVSARHTWPDCAGTLLRNERPWSPLDALGVHARSRAYIEDGLTSIVCQSLGLGKPATPLVTDVRPGDRAVVLTHFAPSRRSLPEDWPGWHEASWVAPSHASDLEDVMHAWGAPALWVHGRAVAPVDYVVGRTRVVANPLRPWRQDLPTDPALVIVA